MILHSQLSPEQLRSEIHHHTILFGGNKKLKIYGLLSCHSGKKMKTENRIFFRNEKEARQNNYRPCGHCMKEAYQQWKKIQQKS
ncbi:Ada metal-binding domain-containing protein [Chryseobacterium sp. JK1]|uniref:Ada metal-binding domain-containing protein n=1 Tax=Chryseobacterium sp. JK1 TaxID=874294 RepID=UPI003D69C627